MNYEIKDSYKRFVSAFELTDPVNLKRLERETYNLLFLGLIVAVLFHGGLVLIFPAGETKVADKNSIQVELVKIPPRIIMPRPAISSRNTTHEIYRFRKKLGTAGVPVLPGGFRKPSGIDYGEMKMNITAPEIVSGKPIGSLNDSILVEEISLRMPKDNVPLKNDIFTDSGQYKSMVVFSPDNKMAVEGYTHIAMAFGANLSPNDTLNYSLENLAEALNSYTNIDVLSEDVCLFKPAPKVNDNNSHGNQDKVSQAVGADGSFKASPLFPETYDYNPTMELSRYPLIYISNDKPFTLTEAEKDNLKNYIGSGGFIILDNPLSEISEGRIGKSLKNAIIEAFSKFAEAPYVEITPYGPATKYRVSPIIPEISFIPIPKNHELFHSFFDFIDGPPGGYWDDSDKKSIEGIYLGGRMIGLYTVGYGLSWNDKRNEEQLKMGVNMVVYALKQGKGKFDWGHITTKTPNRPSVVFTGSGKMKNLSRGNIKVW